MKLSLLLSSFSFILLFTFGANCQIGHTTITFNDPERSGGFGSGGGPGRQIQTELYYPADVNGDNVSVADGMYPIVVFGHGFFMTWSAYENIWEALVPQGYIVCFPRTEGNLSPSHVDFGLDLALVAAETQNLNSDPGSLFFGHVMNRAAIMGHSMGGGCSVLAAASIEVDAIIGLAAANVDPSAAAAAESVTEPMLMLAGSGDAVAPPEDHQIPIYNGSVASCKYYVSITGGGHCYFANSNVFCDSGELFTLGDVTIDRDEQQQTAADYYIPWLNHWLKDNELAFQEFVQLTLTDERTTFTESCVVLSNDEIDSEYLIMVPNPARHEVFLQGPGLFQVETIQFYDIQGKLVFQQKANNQMPILINQLNPGIYIVGIQLKDGKVLTRKIIKE